MKVLLITTMAATLITISGFATPSGAAELPTHLRCGYKVVKVLSKHGKIVQVDTKDSLLEALQDTTDSMKLDGQARSTGESGYGNSITLQVQGSPESAVVRLSVNNAVVMEEQIASRDGLFEKVSLLDGFLKIKGMTYDAQVESVIVSCIPIT